MSTPSRRWRIAAIGALAVVLGGLLATSSRAGASGNGGRSYRQINLVSDIYGVAANLDPNLVNAWGLVHGPTTPWWVADNGTGLSTLYDSSGQAFPSGTPLVVTVAPPPGGSSAAPTGLVFNGTTDFVVTSGSNSAAARFIFATEDGTISGWAPSVDLQNSILTVDDSASGAVYKGLATGTVNGANFLYTTDFHNGSVDVYDAGFNEASGFAFSDPTIPAGFAPFGIANIGGRILVTYAKQDADRHDDVAGPGNGYVDVYSTSGVLQQRLVSQGALNSPWGLALAPKHFGRFSGDLLIGDFGDGHINAYDPSSGAMRGTLRDADGNPIFIGGLWALSFGNDSVAGPSNELFFTAGIGHEADGLFGALKAT